MELEDSKDVSGSDTVARALGPADGKKTKGDGWAITTNDIHVVWLGLANRCQGKRGEREVSRQQSQNI